MSQPPARLDPERPHALLSWRPEGAAEPRRLRLVGSLTLGRDPGCRVLIPLAGVSRVHARLELKPDGLHLDNLSRSQPVGINRRESLPPGGHRMLQAGETFTVGAQELRVDHVHRVGDGPGATCANPSCLRPVPAEATDCPWCGVSLSFAHTRQGPR